MAMDPSGATYSIRKTFIVQSSGLDLMLENFGPRTEQPRIVRLWLDTPSFAPIKVYTTMQVYDCSGPCCTMTASPLAYQVLPCRHVACLGEAGCDKLLGLLRRVQERSRSLRLVTTAV